MNKNFENVILYNIKKVVGNKPIQLHEPKFEGNEIKYLKECIETTLVSSVGPFVKKLEKKLCEYTGTKHAIPMNQWNLRFTTALNLAGVKNDEVLVPALTFVATANAVIHAGGIPNFIDSEIETLGICPIKLEKYLCKIAIIKNNSCFNKITGRKITNCTCTCF